MECKRAFIAGVADDNGYGWAIAKSLAAAGAEILVGTWVPALNIFETSLRRGKFDESRMLPDGSLMEITKVYPLDAVYDSPEDVPEDRPPVNIRFINYLINDIAMILLHAVCQAVKLWDFIIKAHEVAESVKKDFGSIDILVHSLANGPEVSKPLLETSRNGYLAAISASSGASVSLTYIASERIIPGYGGGMSSAKAALESDTKVLAFEAGRKHKIRVNTISAGFCMEGGGFAEIMPSGHGCTQKFFAQLQVFVRTSCSVFEHLSKRRRRVEEVGNAAAFLASPLASAITGAVVYVDNGLNAMGVGVDSPVFADLDIPKAH
ncbi:unnamed protein product [Thlaspi arvense]|uniref:Uncharacterized protein n=1 Tax=Thlaspi arvense TaxID=13288 RepID=A0AAU9RG96_THLAR|nr:unnamed protein product [Thlaspi arvense]